MLALAYKNSVGPRRKAWRIVARMEASEEGQKSAEQLGRLRKYKRAVGDEVEHVCSDLVGLLDTYLIPAAVDSQSRVFYLKLKADYCRYFAECGEEEKNRRAAERAGEAYGKASEIGAGMAPTDPTRLGLDLNYSVFQYEIMNSPEKATKMARSSFEAAVRDIEREEEGPRKKESVEILRLIKENLEMWNTDFSKEAPECYKRFDSL